MHTILFRLSLLATLFFVSVHRTQEIDPLGKQVRHNIVTLSDQDLVRQEELYNDGKPRAVWFHNSSGEREGEYTEWHTNGVLAVTANYKSGKLFGKYKSYDDLGNQLAEGMYDENAKQGFWKISESSPIKLLGDGFFVADQREGIWAWLYRSGGLARIERYEDGELEGDQISWDLSGKRYCGGSFKHGKRDGVWQWWDTTGKVIQTLTYKDGVEQR